MPRRLRRRSAFAHMTSSRAVRHVAVGLAALLTVLVTTATATAAQWQYFETDGDYFHDVAAIDRSGNGVFDDVYFDLDNDGPYDANMYNTLYSDSLLEVLDFDMNENNEIEIRLSDGDQRQGFDYVRVDLDENGYWDSQRGFTRRIIPGSRIDIINQSNRRNVSSTMMHNLRMRTGGSLLYPNLPACC